MSLRVRSLSDLKAMQQNGQLSKALSEQIKRALSISVPADKSSQQISISNSVLPSSRFCSSNNDRALRDARKEFYILPEYDRNADPAVVLYRACVARWGRFYDGGLVVYELVVDAPRKFRIDVALVQHRIAIEFDGYGNHSRLDATKDDHAKTEQLSRLGWIVFRVGKKRVMNDIETFLDSVQMAMDQAVVGDVCVARYCGTKQKASFNSQLLSWKPNRLVKPKEYVVCTKGR